MSVLVPKAFIGNTIRHVIALEYACRRDLDRNSRRRTPVQKAKAVIDQRATSTTAQRLNIIQLSKA